MQYHHVRTIPSTHNALKSNPPAIPPKTMLIAREQTAGRGQRGNSWEAEPGMNLTFSLYIIPVPVPPARQFLISEAFALAFTDLLDDYGISATIKWPNDIYVGDSKICGILIEHSLTGNRIERTILSAGLNVNQTRFLSDAPNPTSILLQPAYAGGNPLDINLLTSRLAQKIEARLDRHIYGDETPHDQFMQRLYRADNRLYPFRDNLNGETVSARISDVAPDGRLTLSLDTGEERSYLFKEVAFILTR
ncbi:MAG: biotin--[acetyl-CoA-carboxylase] ligase [Muribaculaceae bacterium]|nr:biotin--[acetyl-CoA-carboxylase] ligase [Muribaculaceae bacterium]